MTTMLNTKSPRTIIMILHFLFSTILPSPSHETNTTDYASLMAFKSHLVLKPDSILSSNWTSTSHFCNWYGVTCSNHRTLTKLHLSALSITGQLSPQIANMTHLLELDLSSNNFSGVLPTELGSLQHLRFLNLSYNSLHGNIPLNISKCHEIQELDLSFNFFTGNIPQELGLLTDLQHLAVDHNNLTGMIPASLSNLSKLEYLCLHENDLFDKIPKDIGRLNSLIVLGLRGNNLAGSIPPLIFNISTLQVVDFSINSLSGQLPQNLGNHLPNLERLFLDSNRITGKIPESLSNASKLSYLFLTENDLQGGILNEFAMLRKLLWFEFEYNRISGDIPYGLFNITSLTILKTRHNYLSGELPHDLGNNLPNLQEIFLSHNQFSGTIPPSICNATKITSLECSNNSFTGTVPLMLGNLVELQHLILQNNLLSNNPMSTHLTFMDSLVNCRNLEFLVLDTNPLNGIIPESVLNLSSNLKVFTAISCGLKGEIPQGIGNLSSLFYLGLSSNTLQGEVPSSLSGLQNLERVYLTNNRFEGNTPVVFCSIKILGILHLGENQFSGSIPACLKNLTELREFSVAANSLNSTVPMFLWNLVKLEGLNLSRNHLHGALPNELGNLKAVNIMDLSFNNFSGEIPGSIVSLQYLLTLDMSWNEFEGPIPSNLGNLIVMEYLDLSSNSLSGSIPPSIGSLRDLKYLNLSFNMLQGVIPHGGVFENISSQSLMGNPNLCGVPKLNFSLCTNAARGEGKGTTRVLKITLPIAAVLVLIICITLWISLSRRKYANNATRSDSLRMGQYQVITYNELRRATESFSETNLVGEGSSSMVYKAEFPDGTVAAVKVFDMQIARALQNFDAECEVLRQVRHRNLVKIISTCSNIDFKAMVLEFMPNGSLDKWLYTENHFLNLVQRLDIMIDVAAAMEYLHHDYGVPIVHCDLKPSNVLLKEDMTAHVTDFGIAKVLAQDHVQTKTLGTIGYIAPEYGSDGHVATKGDVYSFGILMLETLTRKRPTDEMFGEELRLREWVSKSYPGALTEVLDTNLVYDINCVKEGSSVPLNNKKQKLIEDLVVSIINVGLDCCKELPEERMDMRAAAANLKKIRDEFRHKQVWINMKSLSVH